LLFGLRSMKKRLSTCDFLMPSSSVPKKCCIKQIGCLCTRHAVCYMGLSLYGIGGMLYGWWVSMNLAEERAGDAGPMYWLICPYHQLVQQPSTVSYTWFTGRYLLEPPEQQTSIQCQYDGNDCPVKWNVNDTHLVCSPIKCHI